MNSDRVEGLLMEMSQEMASIKTKVDSLSVKVESMDNSVRDLEHKVSDLNTEFCGLSKDVYSTQKILKWVLTIFTGVAVAVIGYALKHIFGF